MFNPHDTREGKPALYECLIFNDECLRLAIKIIKKTLFNIQHSKLNNQNLLKRQYSRTSHWLQ